MLGDKLLLLRLRRSNRTSYTEAFFTELRARFFKKGRRGSEQTTDELRDLIRKDVAKFHWKLLPRARIAVHISFFPGSINIPELHNMIKFYLDLLKGILFTDDRQIRYLSAFCIKTQGKSHRDIEHDRVFIKIEKFANLINRYKLFQELEHEVNAETSYPPYPKDRFDQTFDSKILTKLGISDETISALAKYLENDKQLWLLKHSSIYTADAPGKRNFLIDVYKQWDNINPFVLTIERLPLHGEKQNYIKNIKAEFEKFSTITLGGKKLTSPIELDVQVRTKNKRLNKDLDNIIIDITKCRELFLSKELYIQGYRVYTVGISNIPNNIDELRIKILPAHRISDFEEYMQQILKNGEQYLESRF